MGTRLRFSPIDGQIPVLIAFYLIIVFINLASSCDKDECWVRYNDAKMDLHENVPGVPDQAKIRCITLRTYSQCINNLTGCIGDIRFHTVHRMVIQKMKQNNCSMKGPIYTPGPDNDRGPQQAVCSYAGETKYKHCGLFGDPHLRTFDGEFQTCKVQGAWPLIDNDFITVQVTNDAVTYDASATATSKLTVMIKGDDCADGDHFVTYQAQTDYLPSFFDDGREYFGPEKSVSIREVTAGKHIEIYIRYIDTTLLVRQVGRYFTFSVRMPENVAQNSRSNSEDISLQLCVDGCPKRERIDYKRFLATQKSKLKRLKPVASAHEKSTITRPEAVAKCRSANVTDFYFDSCVFDLLTTGDTNFTLAAHVAMQDIRKLYPSSVEKQENRTNLNEYDRIYKTVEKSGAPPRTLHQWSLYWALITCLLLKCNDIITFIT